MSQNKFTEEAKRAALCRAQDGMWVIPRPPVANAGLPAAWARLDPHLQCSGWCHLTREAMGLMT